MVAGWALWPVALCDLWETAMSNGKPCEAHNIPVDICARCLGALEERRRIIDILHTQHKEEHIATPSHVCRACRILELINVA